MKKLSIVFMGTPDFASGVLEAILAADIEVKAVVTMPDKPSGRGLKLHESAVKQTAILHHIPIILQPEKLQDPIFIHQLEALNADCFVVVAFRMLPEVVWRIPKQGTLNLHASLLPQYRGAAPINWAIINGETQTGVTTFFIEKTIDTGNIILQESVDIPFSYTAGTLHNKLKETGSALVVKTLKLIADENCPSIPQSSIDEAQLKLAPKIFKEHCKIDWNQCGKTIINTIRGLSPYPGAFTQIDGLNCKIFEASFKPDGDNIIPGTLKTDQKTCIQIACKDGWIQLNSLQLEGKKTMMVDDFLRGYRFKSGNSIH